MYGTCKNLCRLLTETPLNLIVWSPADIEALADGMECAVSDQDIKDVLACLDAIPVVMVPADLLETLLTTAEQALWHREWTARDGNHPVPESVTRRLADTAKVRALMKN
ncbi:DUF1380 domain-containing protein [Salmonella enterica subsp. enterica serovar Give]|nr:DUF1380 domain-containing protein [Salmonella enterica subsp. enterica serovar Give]MIH69666.1 DUF1380 domain-containing protein [Salmonella enterica subsp. enterica serovar Soahanina]